MGLYKQKLQKEGGVTFPRKPLYPMKKGTLNDTRLVFMMF